MLVIKLWKVMQKPAVLELSTHTHTKLFKIWDTSNSCYHFWWCISPKHCEQDHRIEQNWHLLWGKSKNKKKSSFKQSSICTMQLLKCTHTLLFCPCTWHKFFSNVCVWTTLCHQYMLAKQCRIEMPSFTKKSEWKSLLVHSSTRCCIYPGWTWLLPLNFWKVCGTVDTTAS